MTTNATQLTINSHLFVKNVRACVGLGTLIGAGLLATACRPGARIDRYRDAPVILISIDTLRADRLPIYGYKNGATPELDALARGGFVFDDVYSHCPLTLPSHSSLLTGQLPMHHGVRDN